jgi:hypothetical protein
MNTVATRHLENEHWRTKIVAAARAFLWRKEPLFDGIIDPNKPQALAIRERSSSRLARNHSSVEMCSNDGEEGDRKLCSVLLRWLLGLLGQDLKSEAPIKKFPVLSIKDQNFSRLETLMWRNSPE